MIGPGVSIHPNHLVRGRIQLLSESIGMSRLETDNSSQRPSQSIGMYSR